VISLPHSARARLRSWRDTRALDRADAGFDTALAAVRDIEGFTSPVELSLLYHLAVAGGEGKIVEIGSYLGRSTIVMAHAAREAGSPPVVAVDPHTRALGYEGEEPFDTRAQFEANVARAGVADVVQLEHALSTEAAERWDGGPVRLLFVDGWHSHDAVMADVTSWAPYLLRHATVVFDDFLPSPGVRSAVHELVENGVLGGRRLIVGKMAAFGPPALLDRLPVPIGASALGRLPDRALDVAIRGIASESPPNP
jgi:predicted O-methyltransferase YrrM